MELTQEQEDRIVLKVIERVLTLMPETLGNLMQTHATGMKIKKEFFSDYPEFKNHTDVVTAVVQEEDGKELGQDFDEILKRSVPKIREQIRLKQKLNLRTAVDHKDLPTHLDQNDLFKVL